MIGVIIPDRGDRPDFLINCLRMLKAQTLQPEFIELINFKPESKGFDLTQRVRIGFETLKSEGCECVLIIENDDFYSKDYIETMFSEWNKKGRPEIFGTSQTVYYHVLKKQFRVLKHPSRASLMNTLINCESVFDFPSDSEIFLDLYLWKQLKGKTFTPEKVISLGIKHGLGLCGGRGHKEMTLENNDFENEYLKASIDKESFLFYQSIADKLKT